MSALIHLQHIAVENRLENIGFDVHKGECLHILGPNGAGKSTLLAVMAGILEADTGVISLKGHAPEQWALSALATFRTLLAQQSDAVFAVTVKEYISFFAPFAFDNIPEALDRALEVTSFFSIPINKLSGGERQRVEICRALIQVWPAIEKGEAIVLLDEPLQGLDIRHQYALISLTQSLCWKGNTVLMTSHDISLSANSSSSVLLLKQGRMLSYGLPEQVLTAKHLEIAFDCHFAVSKRDDFLNIQVCPPA